MFFLTGYIQTGLICQNNMKLISFKGPLFPTDYVIAISVIYIKEFFQIFNQCELILLFLFLLFTPLLSYPKEQKEEKNM